MILKDTTSDFGRHFGCVRAKFPTTQADQTDQRAASCATQVAKLLFTENSESFGAQNFKR